MHLPFLLLFILKYFLESIMILCSIRRFLKCVFRFPNIQLLLSIIDFKLNCISIRDCNQLDTDALKVFETCFLAQMVASFHIHNLYLTQHVSDHYIFLKACSAFRQKPTWWLSYGSDDYLMVMHSQGNFSFSSLSMQS